MDPQSGPQQDPLIGQTIGNYLVTQKLGEGGMGSVYLAEHPTIGKRVALKVLHAEFSNNEDVARRFFDEAKAVNNINHPNIVDIVDYGVLEGAGRAQLVYFIMEYLAGGTLSTVIRAESPLPPERALAISMQVADALSSSHKCGIVHRDLKPDNIILQQRGRERDFVKLLDFGIAKLTTDGASRTRTGIVMGTPAYMSPEQCEGKANVDSRTDIYALGIVLYEMLTGRVPFIGEGYGEILVQHLTQNPVPPSSFRMLPPHVEVVVLKALEKRMEMRYPSMDEFMRAMADPVGYVEAHGGPGQFLHRQLMPSTSALPSLNRPTPTPSYTPVPGSLSSASLGSGIYPPSTASPTTLGAAAGEAQPKKSRVGFLLAALLILAGAGIAIAVVVSGNKPPATPVAAVVPDAGAAMVTPDAAAIVVDAAIVDAQEATVAIDAAAAPATVTLTFTTKPAGAAIWIDGKDTGVKTPSPVTVAKSEKPFSVVFKASGFEELAKKVPGDANATSDFSLKKKGGRIIPPTGRGSNGGGPIDTKLERPE